MNAVISFVSLMWIVMITLDIFIEWMRGEK